MIPPSLVPGISEHVLNSSFMVTIVILAVVLYVDRFENKKKIILSTLLVENIFIVLGATLFCRRTLPYHRIETMPFWIYSEIMKGNPGVTFWDIIFNLFLLFPLGFLLAGVFRSIKVGHVLMIGLLFSFGIEVFQYILYKGISQFDDLAHNTIGCVVGWLIGKWLIMKSDFT